MSPRITLVSGCDANYYPLLREWLHSVRRCPESAGLDVCILDAGLSAQQRAELAPQTQAIRNPEWPSPAVAKKADGREYLKACVCRPFLPDIFPGYDIYMWMDADTWVQDWRAVRTFLAGAIDHPDRIVLSGAADRAYRRQARIKWLWRWPVKITSFYFSNARRPYGFATAKLLLTRYILSAGCFALSAGAPHWARWQALALVAMTKGKVFTAEQVSLGVLLHVEDYPHEILPAYMHWLCGQTPLVWDDANARFVEPYLPHEPIGIMHMAGVDDMRADHAVTRPYRTLDGRTVQLNYRYPHLDAGPLHTGSPERA